ncbi:bifunctional phosphopantothenoylcysteine decarboxylase/phosphopantothenate--cysteine ligase CoaBC [Campylobacter sp. VicNov18]|uniref:bifunctional phosphopantothenoylcysteine decarboxylase/phosphopantothenate--cysteine ligase CoaBC n=1 Tax=Campylobacter bilis TaxID=2691918 RepID=UPI00130DA4FA|nr:bifunctional phosphopantothenoylcysteine decarboxylase/phosphopantothenate--cysteine ligase CoaBC [Campylobacter bilis]MPV63570.1 bifunctional phosphopantothenoylcysteine decarboxylase/phosphopantothenate--cysteine ligase CoaBC [Campylobacter hepaticus]MBM0637070.1 bifunctional phosphopantothenoylcysteine decarboxylase/phosphopantothenate--cysteine ligase CoaBC [Campylobacter bilis]MCC8277772.1 bifunctional phosphopantothenoylcysteine decarboxylase/phosphopantothenate--cysteine ligase CoaBC [
MKTILLAVSGSIAFYKAYELISLFKKEGFKVKVLLSEGVLKFASKMSFEALADEVLCQENESWQNSKNHIDFSKDVDLVLFAPASVNSINKLALGIADNLFIQTLIATNKPLLIAPAANTHMYYHFSTQNSLKLLKKNKALIIEPICKVLACKEKGLGALAEVKSIFDLVKREFLKQEFWQDKSVIVTGGGTREKIDDVRCISNFSSGKMAKAIADAFYFLGARVKLLSSMDFDTPYKLCKFESSQDLKHLLDENLENDFLIMAAAVSDFIPQSTKGKIKKNDHLQGLNLHLSLNEDLLKNCHFKGKKIGFKMEFDSQNALENAKKCLQDKNLDMICLNIMGLNNYFGSDQNELYFITSHTQDKSILEDKGILAFELAKRCEKL